MFLKFGYLDLGSVSSFDIRISDLNFIKRGIDGIPMWDRWTPECREIYDF